MGGKNAQIETRGRPVVTHLDAMRLRLLVAAFDVGSTHKLAAWLTRLDRLLNGACVLSPETIASDVVTMNSIVRLRDLNTCRTADLELIFPTGTGPLRDRDANTFYRVSVLNPMGLSVLGRPAGYEIHDRLLIETILYQPEAAGEYEL